MVAPLTSLIEDQVSSCTSRGIKAVAVTSKQEARAHLVKAAKKGDFQHQSGNAYAYWYK